MSGRSSSGQLGSGGKIDQNGVTLNALLSNKAASIFPGFSTTLERENQKYENKTVL